MDPIILFQQCIREKKPIFQDAENSSTLCFGTSDTKAPKDQEISFKSKLRNKNLTVGYVWFYLKNKEYGLGQYTRLAAQNNVEPVPVPDQKQLLYVLGVDKSFKSSDIEPIDSAAGASLGADQLAQAGGDAGAGAASQYKRKFDYMDSSYADITMGDGGAVAAPLGLEPPGARIIKRQRTIMFYLDDDDEMDVMSAAEQAPHASESVQAARTYFHRFLDGFDSLTYTEGSVLDIPRSDLGAEFLDYDGYRLERLLKKEIPMSTVQLVMDSQVSAPSNKKSALSTVALDTLEVVKKEEKIRKKLEDQKLYEQEKTKRYAELNALVHPTRQKDFNEQAVWQQYLGTDADALAGIDTTGSILDLAAGKASAPSAAPAPAPYQYQRRPVAQAYEKKRLPRIIIVPYAISSLLTIFNAKGLLDEGVYKTTEEAKKALGRSDKPKYVAFVRNQGKPNQQEYHIMDDPTKLRKEDWERVCAIFTDGKDWQFKGWPVENPTRLLTKYKGFHLTWDNIPPNDSVKKWPVTILKISNNPTKQHTWTVAMRQFWDTTA